MHRYLRYALAVGSVLPPQSAGALNIPVASRVVTFVKPPPSGVLAAVILYEPGNAASEAEAEDIENRLAGGLRIGRAAIRARRVPASAVGQVSGARIAFVTSGVREHQQIADWAARTSVLTITSDLSCVRAAQCIVGVSDAARTQIIVSHRAARSANINFGSAFLMLVKGL